MSPQQIEKIFEPFQSNFEGGTGLGLAIVYQIVQAHGGKVWARSKPGQGTTFVLRLHRLEAGRPAYQSTIALSKSQARIVDIARRFQTLKEDAKAAIERLRAQGIETVMMTGDNRRTAEAIAAQIGIDMVFAEILPQDKAGHVRELQNKG